MLRRLNQDKGLVSDAAQWLASKWAELEGRYGRRTALTMAIGMISTMPIPGNITAIIAAAEAIRAIRGWSEKNLSPDDWTVICGQKSVGTQSVMSEIVRFNSSPTTQGLRQIQGMLNQLSDDEANSVARKLSPNWRLDESKADAIQEIYYQLLAKVGSRKAMPNPMTSGKADETIRKIDDAFRQYSQEEFIHWVQNELGIATFARWPGGKKTKRDALVDMVNRLAVSNTQTSWKDMSSVDETRGGALRKPPKQEPDLISNIIRRFLGTKDQKSISRYAIYDLVNEFRQFMERLRGYGIRVPSMSDEQIARSLEAALTEADNLEFGRRRKELRNGE
jgi:hypothetical protein